MGSHSIASHWRGSATTTPPTLITPDELSEVVVTLPKAALPGSTITLDVQYGGTVTPDSTRLTRMGAPAEMALRNDWDQISEPFTAIRGLGYVVWYPVSLPAVSMSDGNAVFDAIDAWKFRHQRSEFDARIHVISGDAKLCIAGIATISSCGQLGETADPRTGGSVNQISNSIHLSGLGQRRANVFSGELRSPGSPRPDNLSHPRQSIVSADYAAAAEANEPLLNEWLNPAFAIGHLDRAH